MPNGRGGKPPSSPSVTLPRWGRLKKETNKKEKNHENFDKNIRENWSIGCNPQNSTHTHTHTCSLLLSFLSTLFVFSSLSFATTPDISASTTTVSCSDSAINTNNAPANLEINWEPNTINLHWYNGNTELTVPSESQTCTYDGALIPPATIPTRTGYTFAGWKVRDLPYGYTKLEYIHFCATCGINTQKRIGANFEIYATMMYSSSGTIKHKRVLGSNASIDEDFKVAFYSGTLFYSCISGESVNGGIGTPGPDKKFTFGISPEWLQYYNGTRKTLNRPYTGNANLMIGGRGNADVMPMRVYNVKMYNDGNLELNLIPAQRNSDNVLGMWDTVGKTFYTNAASGSFTAGPDAY